jgi:hypothetical protein
VKRKASGTARTAAARKNAAPARKSSAPPPTRRVRPRPGVEVGERQAHPGRPEQTEAFFTDARHATDPLAEELGESFVLSATSGEDPEEHYDRELPEEDGGPYLETSGRTEFGYGVDESNPEDAEPAPWPSVSPQPPRPYRPGGPR